MSEGDAGIEGRQGDPAAAPGWYPDPRGSGNLFYWDGSKWTGDISGPDSTAAAEARKPRDRPRMFVIGGGVVLALSPFFTWVKVILLGNLNLFQLFQAAGKSDVWAWLVVLVGAATAAVAFRNRERKTIWRLGLGVGVIAGIVAILNLERLLHELRDAHGLATVGIGPYVAVGGCIAMVIGAVMAKKRA